MIIKIFNKKTKDSKIIDNVCTMCEEPGGTHFTLIFLDGTTKNFSWIDIAVIHIQKEKHNGEEIR